MNSSALPGISTDKREKRTTLKGVQKPATSLADMIKRAKTVGEKRTLPNTESKEFTHITTRGEFCADPFNGTENEILEDVEIAGVRLIWDHLNFKAYNNRRDLRSLTIYADTVVFRTAYKFPGTKVTIFARELIFEADGCIETTPVALSVPPNTPLDENGNPPDFLLLPGSDGEPGGDVTLHVGRLTVDGDKKRIISTGGRGQNGEKGGLKPYDPKKGNKNIIPITLDAIKKQIEASGLEKDNYSYPDIPDNVVSARIITYSWFVPPTIEAMYLPGTAKREVIPLGDGLSLPMDDFSWSKAHGVRPGDGEDAYPSGKPGRGGNGGTIRINSPELSGDVHATCSTSGGQPGKSSAVAGGEPGTPKSPVYLNVFVVKKDLTGSGLFHRDPSARSSTLPSGSRGKAQSEPVSVDGDEGLVDIADGKDRQWLHPLLLEGVVEYARSAYRNGYREEALEVLQPYSELLADSNTLRIDLKPMVTTIRTIMSNLNNNLDYFGNNIGWLPRLNASTNFILFESERSNALQLLYYSNRMIEKWDSLKRAGDVANNAATSLALELDATQKALLSAYERLEKAKSNLYEIDMRLGAARQKFQRVYDRAYGIAERHEEAMAIFKGVCKVVGGLAQVVPLGQPYLGLAGDIVAEVGNHDWTDEDGAFTWDTVAANFEGFGKNVGEKVDAFRDDNRDLLIKEQKKAGSKGLKRKIDDAKGAIQNMDGEIAALNEEIEREWESVRKTEADRLRSTIKKLESEIAQARQNPDNDVDEVQRLEAREMSLKEELSLAYTERLERAKNRLQKELSNKTSELEKEERRRKQALQEKVEALAKKKEDKKSQIKDLDKKKNEKESKMEDAFDSMNGLGDGIASLGSGISQIFAKVDDAKVSAMLDNFETSVLFDDELKKDLSDFKATLDEVNEEKSSAVMHLMSIVQRIGTYNDNLSTCLSNYNSVNKQRATFDGVLNITTRQYLKGMNRRAQDRLNAYLYEFVKSFQYEYLQDVSENVYNFKKLVDELCTIESVDEVSGEVSAITLDDLKKAEKKVLRSEYLDIARKLVGKRQSYEHRKTNSYECVLSASQKEILAREGCLKFNLYENFRTNMDLGMRDARIIDMELEFDACPADGVDNTNLNIKFEHSGTSIIRDEEGQYWFFQIGKDDDPVSWQYVWQYKDDSNIRDKCCENGANPYGTLQRDERYEGDTELEKEMRDNDEELTYAHYLPSMFSDITLWINKGLEPGKRAADIRSVNKASFKVTFMHR